MKQEIQRARRRIEASERRQKYKETLLNSRRQQKTESNRVAIGRKKRRLEEQDEEIICMDSASVRYENECIPSKYRRTNPEDENGKVHCNLSKETEFNIGLEKPKLHSQVSEDVSMHDDTGLHVKDDKDDNDICQSKNKKRDFMEHLEREMTQRRVRRKLGDVSPLKKQEATLIGKKRRSRENAQEGIISKRQKAHNNPRIAVWEPPVSPYGLLEEDLYQDPWKLLIACMLLNKTSGKQVRSVIWNFFKLCPNPESAIETEISEIEKLIQPLGLFRKRAVALKRFSEEYMKDDWQDPSELYGIGKYASDAYKIFCLGKWKPDEVEPDDKDLQKYIVWLRSTGGLGTGLRRLPSDVES